MVRIQVPLHPVSAGYPLSYRRRAIAGRGRQGGLDGQYNDRCNGRR
jgi:hypothetical protein